MPTATFKKNSVSPATTKKSPSKSSKSSVPKESLALFGSDADVASITPNITSGIKTESSKKLTKKVLKKIDEQDLADDNGGKEVNKASGKDLVASLLEEDTLQSTQEAVVVKKKEIQVETKTEVMQEQKKSSFSLGFLFGKSKKEEVALAEKNKKRDEKVSISEPVKATPIPQKKIADQKRLSTFGLSKERDQFIENLSMLVLSGMSIVGAISSIIKQTKQSGMRAILERMLLEIESGSPVWKAFDKTKFFKGYTISLIRLGEESGNFAENLKVVSLEEEKDREFKSKVKSALMYPIFVLGLTGIVGIGISWFILPKLAKIFYDLKLALPLITKVLLAFGLFLNKHGLVAVPLASIVISAISYVVFFNEKTKFMGEAVIFAIPGVKTLLMEVEVARFGYLLGTLLEAGLPVTKAIDSLAAASEVIRYKKFYIALKDSVEAGNSFEKSFLAYKNVDSLIPPPVQQLIISGEQSGNLNKTLIKVGQVLEAKSDTTTKNLTIIMEPILLVIVWAGVVSVAFAVILPIYSLVGGLNNIK